MRLASALALEVALDRFPMAAVPAVALALEMVVAKLVASLVATESSPRATARDLDWASDLRKAPALALEKAARGGGRWGRATGSETGRQHPKDLLALHVRDRQPAKPLEIRTS
jgi:hypothetical protein